MMPEDRKNKVSCSQFNYEMELGIEVLSGKWKSPILWILHEDSPIGFNELLRRLQGATQKMLTQQLKTLEQQGLVVRTVMPTTPPMVQYSLSALGKEAVPVLQVLNAFGKKIRDNYAETDETPE